MSLLVHTARISSRDPDRFDVTRKSGGAAGDPFAPSWGLLGPALAGRRDVEQMRALANGKLFPDVLGPTPPEEREKYLRKADEMERRLWSVYAPAYVQEMRASYRRHPEAWRALLARERVVLVCYCTDPERCHRTLLAGILGKLGADVRGELPR